MKRAKLKRHETEVPFEADPSRGSQGFADGNAPQFRCNSPSRSCSSEDLEHLEAAALAAFDEFDEKDEVVEEYHDEDALAAEHLAFCAAAAAEEEAARSRAEVPGSSRTDADEDAWIDADPNDSNWQPPAADDGGDGDSGDDEGPISPLEDAFKIAADGQLQLNINKRCWKQYIAESGIGQNANHIAYAMAGFTKNHCRDISSEWKSITGCRIGSKINVQANGGNAKDRMKAVAFVVALQTALINPKKMAICIEWEIDAVIERLCAHLRAVAPDNDV
jgi:hypothetical protein